MTAALDKLQHWSFAGIPLAIEAASVRIGVRAHEHVYPHTPGAVNEKMGRNNYQIDVSGVFDENLPGSSYPDPLWAATTLRIKAENEVTDDLVIPWLGTIQAFCKECDLSETNKIRSGLAFKCQFIEDSNNSFLIQQIAYVNKAPMKDALVDFGNQGYKADIFSKIASTVGKILGYKDQFELYSALVQSKIGYLEGLFREADADAKELSDPANITGLNAFMALWATVRDFSEDIASKGLTFMFYVTPRVMTLEEVAVAIYRDASMTGDLLGLNAFENVFAIPAGTKIRYYEQA